MPNPILRDNDRKVKVFQNGTPVSASPLQSVYAKYLNFIGLTVSENAPLGAYDVSAGATTDEKVIAYINGTQIGSVARRINFSSDFTGSDDSGNGRFDIGLPGRTMLPDGTTTTKSKIGTFYGGSQGFNGLLAGAVLNSTDNVSELAAADLYTTFTNSGGATGDMSGFSTPFLMTRRDYNPTFKIRFKGSPTTQKMFIGFYDDVVPPAGATNPLTSHHGAAFGYNSADATFAAWWGAGGAAQKLTAGLAAKNTTVHDLTITLNATSVVMIFDGTTVVNSITTPPGATTSLALHANMEDAGSDPSFSIAYSYVYQDH